MRIRKCARRSQHILGLDGERAIAPIRHKLMVLSTERKLMMTKARVKRKCEHRFSIMDIEHRTSDLLFVLFSLMLFHVFISLFFFLRSFFLPDWNSIRLLIHVQHNVTNGSTLNLQVNATCASLSFALALALALFGLCVSVSVCFTFNKEAARTFFSLDGEFYRHNEASELQQSTLLLYIQMVKSDRKTFLHSQLTTERKKVKSETCFYFNISTYMHKTLFSFACFSQMTWTLRCTCWNLCENCSKYCAESARLNCHI